MLQDLKDVIESLLRNKQEHSLDDPTSSYWLELQNVLSSFTPQTILNSALSIIESDQYECGSSILHENGFFKISLFKDPTSEFQIRLHFWPEGAQDTNAHNHRWNFLSALIFGEMKFTNWNYIKEDSSNNTLFKLSDANSELVKTRESLGNHACNIDAQYSMLRGDIHYCNHERIHSGRAEKNSLTLMFTGSPKKDSTIVSYRDNGAMSTKRTAISKEKKLDLIHNAIRTQNNIKFH